MPHFLVLTHIYTQLAQKPVKHVTASWQRVFDRPSMLTSSICEGKEREKNGNVFCAHIKYTKEKLMVICSYMNTQVQCLLKLCRDFAWSSILRWKKAERFTVFSGFVFQKHSFFRANQNFGNTLLCLYRKQISVPVLWCTFYLPVYKNLLAFMVSEALLYSSSHERFWQQTQFLSGKNI